jgi:hypothetical protein
VYINAINLCCLSLFFLKMTTSLVETSNFVNIYYKNDVNSRRFRSISSTETTALIHLQCWKFAVQWMAVDTVWKLLSDVVSTSSWFACLGYSLGLRRACVVMDSAHFSHEPRSELVHCSHAQNYVQMQNQRHAVCRAWQGLSKLLTSIFRSTVLYFLK